MRKQLTIGLVFIICTSCATVFNGRTKKMTVVTNKATTIVFNTDTLKSVNNHIQIEAPRKKTPIAITILNDTISKDTTIKSRKSFAFWANACNGIGFIIDRTNDKRFTYPSTIYIWQKAKKETYSIDKNPHRNKFILKIAPTKIFGITNPGIDLSAEKGTGNHFATQATATYLTPQWFCVSSDNQSKNIKGFRFALEEKYYIRGNAPNGLYLATELSYLNTRYRTIEEFDHYTPRAAYKDDYDTYSDSIRIKKETYSINIKFGYQKIYKNLTIDMYIGIGARYKNTKHFDRILPQDYISYEANSAIIQTITNEENKCWRISLPLGFKIGWAF